jgi:hypothetical protein
MVYKIYLLIHAVFLPNSSINFRTTDGVCCPLSSAIARAISVAADLAFKKANRSGCGFTSALFSAFTIIFGFLSFILI